MKIHDAQPRYMNFGGHESDVKIETSECAVVKSEKGEKKMKTYDSSGDCGAFFSHEG